MLLLFISYNQFQLIKKNGGPAFWFVTKFKKHFKSYKIIIFVEAGGGGMEEGGGGNLKI